MAIETVIGYAVALSLPVWLAAEQLYSWRESRRHEAESEALRMLSSGTAADDSPRRGATGRTIDADVHGRAA
jgi:hypothetical protein